MEYIKKYFLSFFLLILIHPTCFAKYTDDYITVFSREPSYNYKAALPNFTSEQLTWLRKKEKLVLAVPLPDNPPMDITMRSERYEGATADVLGLLANILDIDIVAKKYSSRDAAILAVESGDADMISSANEYEVENGLSLTSIYIEDQPALYKNIGVENDRIRTIAVPSAYLPMSEVIRYMPGVKVDIYSSRYSAVAAAAYGKADAVLIDMVSGNFIINKLYQDSIHLVRPLFAQTKGFAFGIKSDHVMLRESINIALDLITTFHHKSILKRWSGGGLSIESKPAMLTEDEWKWINEKGIIKIAVNKGAPPLSFIDVRGNLHGIAIDVLQIIGAKLGVQVDAIPINSSIEQLEKLKRRDVDAVIIMPTKGRKKKLLFSSSFMLDPMVMIVSKNNIKPSYNEVLERGRVAQIRGLVLEDPYGKPLRIMNPVWENKWSDVLDCVATSRCDMALAPLRAAKYLINSEHAETLVIVGEIFESQPISAAFAFNRDQENLMKIINKVLSSIPPDELDVLSSRWRVSAKHNSVSFVEFLYLYIEYILVALVLFVLAFFWILYLRRQIKLRRKAETELSIHLNFIEELVDSTPHPIYARDINGCLILCNDSYAAFFGVKKNDLIGLTLDESELRWPYMSVLSEVYRKTIHDTLSRDGDHALQLSERILNIYHWLQVYRGLSGVTVHPDGIDRKK
ncbi:transporter substrate-binding domain-containing protein [Aeromonas salmonicida]|uniref:transporter substrate-binding domain-containing protein n=1 Tax=Aeromonas salmonicida TaxID=645 RepID=UPI0035A5D6FA